MIVLSPVFVLVEILSFAKVAEVRLKPVAPAKWLASHFKHSRT